MSDGKPLEPVLDPYPKDVWEVRCGMLGCQKIKKSACPTAEDAARQYGKDHHLTVLVRNDRLWGSWTDRGTGVVHEHPFLVEDVANPQGRLPVVVKT